MRTHQSMTRPVYSVLPEVTIAEAANITPRRHIKRASHHRDSRETGWHRVGGIYLMVSEGSI